MGERKDTILAVGCPSGDIVKRADLSLDPAVVNSRGRGAEIDTTRAFLLVVFHPTTTEYGNERGQMEELLAALGHARVPTVLLWPNIDAGSDHISKAIRVFRDTVGASWMRTLINLSPEEYLRVLAGAACAVGNSSSFVRDASFVGTPVVLVGARQEGRETDVHVARTAARREEIFEAIERQLGVGRYPASVLYGDGESAERIADGLANLVPYAQKRLAYVFEPDAAVLRSDA
jgi:UDP-N-acetylglucosamine 2-epimerase